MKMITDTNFVKIFLFSIAICSSLTSFSQENETEDKKISFSGSIDAYYQTNLSASDKILQSPGTSFANETGFALGMANAMVTYKTEKTGAVADLVFGPRGDEASGGYQINQLYAYWNVTDDIKLTAGRFNTFLGYEVISPTANFNYSTSYLFSYGPFSHVGLKADFYLTEKLSLMLAFMNVTDVNNNITGAYSFGAQLGYSGQYLNFYYDNKASLGVEIDYTGGITVTEDFYLGINAAYQDNDGIGFYGAALYPQLATTENLTMGLRGEYFVENGAYGAIGTDVADSSVFALTLTASYTMENLTIKPEIRLDSASDDAFLDRDSTSSKSLSSLLIAAVYAF
ncbi:Putative beta-barrel porin-2, OmpL-like. bbp2 [Arenibacter nanhaiticus]|uniref:Putative beta-barrel porin-2, OmpL-like. bbp2 n=1 Tax=Arenibacter nanhaiticus TaxID=558155 RepID=A0A1M6BJI4_9FLAO|nr:outer membrane beta-barrel protein [Arenibacter nanhaiticus]SHI48748.1 Putative beta-barrel porin-2, OmpL-like. bbp2 [Arenibacter nanhaiticus]